MGDVYSDFVFVNSEGHLQVERCDCVDLCREFGTPLYVISEGQIRHNYRRFREAFSSKYKKVVVASGVKANASLAVRRILAQEGSGSDCFGLGELYLCLLADTDPSKLFLNGSNKTREELQAAVEAGVTINVDNRVELCLLGEVARGCGRRPNVNLRVKLPLQDLEGEVIHDYRYVPPEIKLTEWATGHKFGMELDDALQACRDALAMDDSVRLVGLHSHLKGQTLSVKFYEVMINELMEFCGRVKAELGWEPALLDLGGGGRPWQARRLWTSRFRCKCAGD